MNKLNKQQKKAVEHTEGPLMIIAGAGTGKTTVVSEKFAYLIERGLARPDQILALTFTDKAAEEMVDRVEVRINSGYSKLYISTFHTFCKELLEEYGFEIGLPSPFSLLTEVDAWVLVKRNFFKFDLDYYRPLGNPTTYIKAMIKHFVKCKEELITPDDYLKFANSFVSDDEMESVKYQELARAYEVYTQLLYDHNSLDMQDLIYHSYRLLTERPHILRLARERFPFVIVDEFQDVNWTQYQLVRLLAGDDGNLTVVGDDDQSVYAFRGANVSNILRFIDDYPKTEKVVLTQNYRSTQDILDTAYQSIRHNDPDRLESKLKIEKRLIAQKKNKGSSVFYRHFLTDEEEVNFVIDKIKYIYGENDDVSWDDFAIIIRSNSQADSFMQGLSRVGVPYEFLASKGLFRQKVVLDSLCFFRILINYKDDKSMYRLLRLPQWSIRESDIHSIISSAKKLSRSYFDTCRKIKDLEKIGGQNVDRLIGSLVDALNKVKTSTPTNLLLHFLESTGYMSFITHEIELGNREIVRQAYQLNKFFSFVSDYEKLSPEHDVKSFVEYVDELIDAGDNGSLYEPVDTPDSVNIITAHKAKGLEYKYVFVIKLSDDNFPFRNMGQGIALPTQLVHENLPEGDAHLQEERRLFYVAITRAKEGLYLTYADFYTGTKKKKKPSRFLMEVNLASDSKLVNEKVDPLLELSRNKSEEIIAGEFVYAIPKKFSFSQIRSYDTCPYQYKLSSVLKIPRHGSASSSFGRSIHNTLQEFYNRVIKQNSPVQEELFGTNKSITKRDSVIVPTIEELMNIYEEKWIPYDYDSEGQRKKYKEEGHKILELFYQTNMDNWYVPISLEGWFKIMIGEDVVHGRMDRVDMKDDGSLEIIDYKTGKSKEKLTSEDKEQLLIYHIAADTLPEFKNIGPTGDLTFYYVGDGTKLSFRAKEKDIDKLKKKITKIIGGIKNRDFTPKPSSFNCGYCDFKNICDYSQA